ncbi:MAG TPA: ferritin-like protein [Pyrinomonadaceae bacterium]|nr:ferritin-like protein [Pyrinomonadaceae bacterium]
MLTSKPKKKLKRLLPGDEPEELPQPKLMRAAAAVAAPSAEPPPRWVRLLREDVQRLPKEARVKNIEQLRKLLRRAVLIEHTTIPPYLTALYSLKEGTNEESAQVIKGVLVEEMLHWILATNVLNAVGGEPNVNDPRFIPSYPSNLLDLLNTRTDMGVRHLDDLLKVDAVSARNGAGAGASPEAIEVGILKFSEEAIDVFLQIETPTPKHEKPSATPTTIGAFYKILIDGLETLEAEARRKKKTIFTGDPARQIRPEHYYGSGGQAIVVTDLHTARRALKEIIFQGEGFDPRFYDKDISIGDYDEIGHYYQFDQIKQGRYYEEGDTPETGPRGATLEVDWDSVYNMKPNPTLKDYRHNPELREKGKAFNQGYMKLLDKMQTAFTGQPDALQEAVVYMFRLKYLAAELLKNPIGAGGLAAGPIFGYQGKAE